jgi:hypothetical protein
VGSSGFVSPHSGHLAGSHWVLGRPDLVFRWRNWTLQGSYIVFVVDFSCEIHVAGQEKRFAEVKIFGTMMGSI